MENSVNKEATRFFEEAKLIGKQETVMMIKEESLCQIIGEKKKWLP